ncbi:MAG: HAMP domain-containing sensor histidine kinase [Pseudomonadota bacterium]|uniref:sensor histidine kinase n=1 Tax=Polaromonas sp. YR568 TaxID=1855301 RepID=UPI00272901B5|nr:HAMP domain-containing sensor histidine kinase [Polaromonas sp.]MDO9259165.1 HAMP domain-containing sensor histidine kinase [Polaromonas sp.]
MIRTLWSSPGAWVRMWCARIRAELLQEQLVLILHPSRWRLRWLGLFTLVGHPLFGWIWGQWLPQPYESPALRAVMGTLGLLLISESITNDPSSKLSARIFSVVFWIQLPVFFSWMYLCNNGNTVWLASFCAMVLIYYHVTDWRAATLGTVSGALLAWTLFQAFGPAVSPMSQQQFSINAVVIAFSWASAMLLGLSSANLRREHLQHTLTTMGIMAHELRTPLATMSLIGDAVRNESRQVKEPGGGQRLDQLVVRLHTLVRNMNQQIDTQIANARLLRLPTHRESVAAAALLRNVVKDYPYRNSRERESVVLVLRKDFSFESSYRLFAQVINNLLKNAFRALAATSSAAKPGDLRIEVGVLNGYGRIIVTDQGTGIAPELQARIFEPFFSTDRGTGHGLGLAFCQQVVEGAGGSIRVKSEPGRGAIFIIELPILR